MRPVRRPRRGRFRNPLGAIVVLVAIAVIAALTALLSPAPILAGRGQAVDGDTLRIGETRIRLVGLDAVELHQTCRRDAADWACGEAARGFVAAFLAQGEVRCAGEGRDRYGRELARCAVAGTDLGDAVVRNGWAVAELEYGLALAEARLNGRGIWAGSFEDPAAWRRRQGEAPPADFRAWLRDRLGI